MKTVEFDSSINFTTAGELSIFFIGTGSAFSKINYQTNLLIIKGHNHFLVDCGSLCPYALETDYNTRLSEIKNLILTHPHADHIGGVEELALVGRYINRSKINLLITDEFKKKLWNESLRGGIQYSEDGKMTFDDYFNQIKPVRINKKPFEMFEVNYGNLNIKLFRTMHVTTKKNSITNSQISYGLIIDNKVLFTADTQFKPDQLKLLLEKYPTIEYIFHDCDAAGYSEGVHASYKQLCTLDPAIKAKTFLCHYNSAAQKVDPITDGFLGFAKPKLYYVFD